MTIVDFLGLLVLIAQDKTSKTRPLASAKRLAKEITPRNCYARITRED